MMRMKILVTSLMIAALALAGCTANTFSGNKVVASTRVEPKLVDANTDFAFRLYRELLQAEGENKFFSPASVAFALSMTYNGAAGETREGMAQALGIEALTLEELNRANADLRTILQNPEEKVKTNIANSLWADNNALLVEDFVQRNSEFYEATVETLDLADPSAPDTINNWVERETQGKIKDLIEALDPDSQLVLVNAIYFKGDWSTPFKEEATMEDTFNLADGKTKTVPMMYKQEELGTYAGEGFKAIRLPYGQERFSMYVFVPDKGLDQFYQKLTAENWQQWMSSFEKKEAEIYLPRFKAEFKTGLNNALINLGMGHAFSGNADFSGMTPGGGWCIDEVIHQAAIEVNEKGTEAAAATGVVMKAVSLPQYFTVRADKPFFFAIRDDVTGTILFMGEVNNPQ
jgi:serpin B